MHVGKVIFLLIFRYTLCIKSVNPFGCLVNKCFSLVCCLTFDCVHGVFVRQKFWVWIESNGLIFSFQFLDFMFDLGFPKPEMLGKKLMFSSNSFMISVPL